MKTKIYCVAPLNRSLTYEAYLAIAIDENGNSCQGSGHTKPTVEEVKHHFGFRDSERADLLFAHTYADGYELVWLDSESDPRWQSALHLNQQISGVRPR